MSAVAQQVKEVPLAVARRLVAQGKQVPGKKLWWFPARGETIGVTPSARAGYVRLLIMRGCVC